MTASEAKTILKDKVAFDVKYCNEHECAEACKLAYKALDLLERKERGLIIELPMAIGSDCYKFYATYKNKYTKRERHSIVYTDVNLRRAFQLSVCGTGTISIEKCQLRKSDVSRFGKFVFATREEAEARLKELRGE